MLPSPTASGEVLAPGSSFEMHLPAGTVTVSVKSYVPSTDTFVVEKKLVSGKNLAETLTRPALQQLYNYDHPPRFKDSPVTTYTTPNDLSIYIATMAQQGHQMWPINDKRGEI